MPVRSAWPLVVAALLAGCAHAPALPPPAVETASDWRVVDLALPVPAFAPEQAHVHVILPPGYDAAATRRYPVLYVNDGQDRQAVGLRPTLARLHGEGTIRPVIVVAIDMLHDRMGTYGLSDRAARRSVPGDSKYGPVGARAHDYSEWVATALVPYVDAHYRTEANPGARAVLGWSLGALNAFNLGWQYPDVFARVGAFSPSFWLASDRSSPGAVQRTRLAQAMVDGTPPRNGARWFFAVGTDEETDDRDGDGVNDAVDDTRDLIEGWHGADGAARQGLAQRGCSVDMDWANAPARTDVAFMRLPGGQHNQAAWARMLPQFLRWAYAVHAPPLQATGTVESWQDVDSRFVAPRTVDVWLPPGYAAHPHRRYPVVYMHDGQNLFDPTLSYTGVDWGVDEAMTRLIAQGRVRPAIVVGIWNTPLRFQEYMPRKPVAGASVPMGEGMPSLPAAAIVSDDYLRFLVEELKPFVDARYRTRPGRADTVVMGSSMGGLISAYAMAEYPRVFGAAGGLSTHWPAGDGAMVGWLGAHAPDPRVHRFWFDHGTATLDAQYAPYQKRMDAALRAAGYRDGRSLESRVFPGADHSERAWRARVDQVLEFLLGR